LCSDRTNGFTGFNGGFGASLERDIHHSVKLRRGDAAAIPTLTIEIRNGVRITHKDQLILPINETLEVGKNLGS
jgi:hypothetical protein